MLGKDKFEIHSKAFGRLKKLEGNAWKRHCLIICSLLIFGLVYT